MTLLFLNSLLFQFKAGENNQYKLGGKSIGTTQPSNNQKQREGEPIEECSGIGAERLKEDLGDDEGKEE